LKFRKKLFFLFPDVALHHLAEHAHLGIVEFFSDVHYFDFADHVLYGRMLDDRFVDQIVVLGRLAGPRIENLLFDLGMNL